MGRSLPGQPWTVRAAIRALRVSRRSESPAPCPPRACPPCLQASLRVHFVRAVRVVLQNKMDSSEPAIRGLTLADRVCRIAEARETRGAAKAPNNKSKTTCHRVQ